MSAGGSRLASPSPRPVDVGTVDYLMKCIQLAHRRHATRVFVDDRFVSIPATMLDGSFVGDKVPARDRYKLKDNFKEYRQIVLEKQAVLKESAKQRPVLLGSLQGCMEHQSGTIEALETRLEHVEKLRQQLSEVRDALRAGTKYILRDTESAIDTAEAVAAAVSPGGRGATEGPDVDPDVASLLQSYDEEQPSTKRQRKEEVEEEAFDPTKALVWNPVTKSYVPAHLLGSETQSESWRD